MSFEDTFFSEHAAGIKSLERAERFVAQREALTEAAEQTLFNLLEEHGRPGNVVILGDTALFGLCEALDLPRRLYDETLAGSRGFWILVVPGVIHNLQPRFNHQCREREKRIRSSVGRVQRLNATAPDPLRNPTIGQDGRSPRRTA